MDPARRLPVASQSGDGLAARSVADNEGVVARLASLLRLELELGLAEARQLIRTVLLAVAVAVPAAIALIAAFVLLVAAAVAPFFDARWEPLLIAGGAVALLALLALAWSAWRLTHLSWPTETLKSFEETWRWLAAQMRSRLTLRSPAA
jgi:Putative Actinobacterial Holin-X, holin superfamily III